jgi:DNA-directed RNA polymerase I subunit RPA2
MKFFTELSSLQVRALLPDAWGFVCPVHTPDGSPCGLLNHLTMSVNVTTEPEDASKLPQLLLDLGLIPNNAGSQLVGANAYSVLLDGKAMGFFKAKDIQSVVDKMRTFKVNPNDTRIAAMTELCLVPRRPNGQYPGLFIFTGASRMMRPVMNIAMNAVEWIGTFEQVYLETGIRGGSCNPSY